MSRHIEWAHAAEACFRLMTEEEVAELDYSGTNPEGFVGMYIGDNDGAVVYGSKKQIAKLVDKMAKAIEEAGWAREPEPAPFVDDPPQRTPGIQA